MNNEDYGHFIDIEDKLIYNFPDNFHRMINKYNLYPLNRSKKININVNVNVLKTIPEENSDKSFYFNLLYITLVYFILILFILYQFVCLFQTLLLPS